MSGKKKTLYDILGVLPEANLKEIQKAFRSLSKTVHPDVSDASDAPERFAEIKEAYEILTDEGLRKRYDKQLKEGNETFRPDTSFADIFSAFFDNQGGPARPIRGENIEIKMAVTVEEILRGASKSVNLKKRKRCGDCDGTGKKPTKADCPHCKGEGGKRVETRTPFGTIVTYPPCEHCNGSGKAEFVICKKCDGKGNVPDTEVFDFQLDPTSRFGKTLVFKHKGNAGTDGGETGDVRILLEQTEYDRIQVQFDVDLKEKKFVPLRKILLGNPYQIVFPDGTSEEITLADEVNQGSVLVFPEKGLYDDNGVRGFYNLEIVVEYPSLNRLQRHQILTVLGDE